jgi:hypothetical protein
MKKQAINKVSWFPCFQARTDLASFKQDALLLFALQLKFGIEDVTEIASTSLVDSPDDKKIDLVYIDSELGYAVIAQTYISDDMTKKGAPANKASDLNTAASWLLNPPLKDLPETIRPHAEALRSAIQNKKIKALYIWYVHNLPESKNVNKELATVEHTVQTAIKANFAGCVLEEIQTLEVGSSILEKWYKSLQAPILISDQFEIPIVGGYEVKGTDWKAYVTTIPARWLYERFKEFKDDIFSANVRGYMGSRPKDANINYFIKYTSGKDPQHFWVFNNGITALVHSYKDIKKKIGAKQVISIQGISIVNGAQTTGAIGSLEKPPLEYAQVQIRFVVCTSPKIIEDIVRYNNSQNKITAPDFRSGDSIQTQLAKEFPKVSNLQYLARRGGSDDVIRRKTNALPSITAGQALAAFHNAPEIAYNQKTDIWESDRLYSTYFNEQTTAGHVFFAYSLLRAVEDKKLQLVSKSRESVLTQTEQEQLDFLRLRGAIILFTSAISFCLEIILASSIPNPFKVSFKNKISMQDAVAIWKIIIDAGMPFSHMLKDGLSDGLKNNEKIRGALRTFRSLVESTKAANSKIFSDFASKTIIN